MLLDIAPE